MSILNRPNPARNTFKNTVLSSTGKVRCRQKARNGLAAVSVYLIAGNSGGK
jgi:hypothetical protein